ncbi:RagB/SusD family nutrient uptake outer membrane protein [Dyadobacter aurulentus]|uniref:RagB/SusD family nutrient uptake outer membrane protein n=1 Tax=Dyadobacter sp. UC 10 TaxID=2605428 RepID=UPI0011F1F2F2|nr:RagB/SusD family nutrient uptake outer membrane protein [Dyadobacter sp. UC 10]KAA0991233.1 RagB/SusD family nutrient uptake outer membrane protein [Dyadobacter sp. UC 10]
MKKYKILLLTCSVVAMLVSCNEKLDLPSDGRITMDQVFSDYNRTRGYLNSCYGFTPKPYMDRASFTDEAQDADDITPGSKYIVWYGGNVTSLTYPTNSADGSPWGKLYEGIRKCNVFIENIKTATVYASEGEKNSWIAQAHTLRALYYLQLIKRYGGVPIFDKPLEIDHDFSQDKRATFAEVVTFILADCDKALSYPATREGLSWDVFDNQYGIMTRAVAYAVKSQAVTYAASPLWTDGTYTWQNATTITAEALGQCLANGYRLFDEKPAANIAQNSYALYFFTSSNDQRATDKETIYHAGDAMQVWRFAGMPTNPGMERTGPCPTQDLVDSYEMANGQAPITGYSDAIRTTPIINAASGYKETDPYTGRDPRFYASIYYNGAVRNLDQPAGKKVETFVGGAEEISDINRKHTRTGYYLRKFNNFRSGQNNDADGAIRLFRLAELYLNFAEAANQSVGPDAAVPVGTQSMSARQAVNMVRTRAGMPGFPAGMTKEAFEKKYRNERRIELAFEEHRFFDVRRWKILADTDRFVTGMRITRSGTNFVYRRFKFANRNAFSDKYLMYPIDQAEVDKIIGLSGADWQNPGWLD